MSKLVTIPHGMNPFVVIFNGDEYVYEPGTTVRVPDGVAIEIEEYIENQRRVPSPVQPPFQISGADGVGILSVIQTHKSTEDEGDNTVLVSLTNGAKFTFTVRNGSKGSSGDDGVYVGSDTPPEGAKVWISPGLDGEGEPLPILRVKDADGSWREIPAIRGADGKSVYIESVTESDDDGGENIIEFNETVPGQPHTLIVKNGRQGSTGKDGTSVSIVDISESSSDGGTNAVSFSDGKILKIKNGNRGSDGSNGNDGISPTVSLSKEGKITTLSVTDANGTKTTSINDGNSITIINTEETPADDDYNRMVFSDGTVLKVKNGRTGSPGKDGESITIEDTYESYLDGGKNTVTFSDGTVLTIRNGRRGSEEQPDWGENDQRAGNFIQNRTHWVEQTLEQLTSDWGMGAGSISGTSSSGEIPEPLLKAGERYVVNPDGFYYCTAYEYTDNSGTAYIALGDSRLDPEGGAASESHPEDTPCLVKFRLNVGANGKDWTQVFLFYYPDTDSHYTAVYSLSSDVVYHPLDERFIPETIARVSQLGEGGGGGITIVSVNESTADGGSNVVTFSDGTTLTIKNGSKGSAGSNGVSATHSWSGTTLTVTSASGTSSANLKGDKGDKGDTGPAGSDANVTSANITAALGYTPANGANYLPIAGGTLTGAVTLPNNTAIKSKNSSGAEQEVIRANGSDQIVLGAAGIWDLIVSYHGLVPATSAVNTLDIGADARRWRNLYLSGNLSDGTNNVKVADIAKKSDIPAVPTLQTETWTFTLEDGSTVTKKVYVE